MYKSHLMHNLYTFKSTENRPFCHILNYKSRLFIYIYHCIKIKSSISTLSFFYLLTFKC